MDQAGPFEESFPTLTLEWRNDGVSRRLLRQRPFLVPVHCIRSTWNWDDEWTIPGNGPTILERQVLTTRTKYFLTNVDNKGTNPLSLRLFSSHSEMINAERNFELWKCTPLVKVGHGHIPVSRYGSDLFSQKRFRIF